jgi:hypothetical protein
MSAVPIIASLIYNKLATAVLPAVTGFVVVHGAVLAALLAALRRGLGRKRASANRCRQNREENFHVRLHTLNLLREMNLKQAENPLSWRVRIFGMTRSEARKN